MLTRRETLRATVSAPLPTNLTATTITETKALVTDIQSTYPSAYEGLPQTATAEALSRLFAIHTKLLNFDAAENALLEMLKALRVLELRENGILPLGGMLEEATVVNVLLLADLQKKARQDKVAHDLEDFARRVYLILNGDMDGYDKVVVPGV